MTDNVSAYRGFLLGLAVGDALGFTVDDMDWATIADTYGPCGLMGFDLANGNADVTSYTQTAAYVANGLLIGVTRSRAEGYSRFVTLALKEWAQTQFFYRDPDKTACWITKIPALRRHLCRDSRMLDAIRAGQFGTPEEPANRNSGAGALTGAALTGLFYKEDRMSPLQVGQLASQIVALTHGDRQTILAGAVAAYITAGLLMEPWVPMKEQFSHAIDVAAHQFSDSYPEETAALAELLNKAISLAEEELPSREAMEQLKCITAAECLAGALYACLSAPEDMDAALVTAVNHSGRSAVTGALTGAFLGTFLGVEAVPEFYLESLEPRQALNQLADDLAQGSPTAGLFDDAWDHKYTQGLPL